MKNFILAFIRQHPSVTLGEVVEACEHAGCKVHGDREILVSQNRFIWAGVSCEFGEAIQSLIASRWCEICRTSMADFLASSPRMFRSPRFLPVRLRAAR